MNRAERARLFGSTLSLLPERMETFTLVYDGSSPNCMRLRKALLAINALDVSQLRPLQALEPETRRRVDPRRFRNAIALLVPGGRVLYGARAVRQVLAGHYPLVAKVLGLPVIGLLFRLVYTLYARNRDGIGPARLLPQRPEYGPTVHTGWRLAYLLLCFMAGIGAVGLVASALNNTALQSTTWVWAAGWAGATAVVGLLATATHGRATAWAYTTHQATLQLEAAQWVAGAAALAWVFGPALPTWALAAMGLAAFGQIWAGHRDRLRMNNLPLSLHWAWVLAGMGAALAVWAGLQ